MSASNIVSNVFRSLLVATPVLAAWTAAVVLSVIMLRRGGGKAERFLLAGSCVMLAQKLFETLMVGVMELLIIPALIAQGWTMGRILSYNFLFFGLVSLAGIVLLVYAFWIKFKVSLYAHS